MVRVVGSLFLVSLISQPMGQPTGQTTPTLELMPPSPSIILVPSPEFKLPQNNDQVVLIRQKPKGDNTGGCSAFAVRAGKVNVYVTAQHCVDNGDVRVRDQEASVVLADADLDLAVITIPIPPKNSLRIGQEPNHTEMAVGIGFVGGTPTFIVTRKAAQENAKVIWTPKFLPGMSGGPILNRKGEVIGIVQNVGNPTSVFDGIAISSGAEELRAFVKRAEEILATRRAAASGRNVEQSSQPKQ